MLKWFPPHHSGGHATTKTSQCLSDMSFVFLTINRTLTMTSHAVHKSSHCLLRHGIPLLSPGSFQVMEVLESRVTSLSMATELPWRVPQIFLEIRGTQISRKCEPLHSGFPSLQLSLLNDPTLMSWCFLIQGGKIRPVLLILGHNDWINGVIRVVLACRCQRID